jgi:hypothetical protein
MAAAKKLTAAILARRASKGSRGKRTRPGPRQYTVADLERARNQTTAVSVLTDIHKFDKRAEGFRGHYDMLSERCHPNSLGHNFMFSKLDRSDGTVRFYDEREPARNGQMILGALVPLPLAESISARLDELIDKVSDLHHRVAPVSGPGGEPRSS